MSCSIGARARPTIASYGAKRGFVVRSTPSLSQVMGMVCELLVHETGRSQRRDFRHLNGSFPDNADLRVQAKEVEGESIRQSPILAPASPCPLGADCCAV